jgi:hypothetical protein
MITALGSYGIKGSIVMSTGMRKTTTLASVDFCSALPNGALGLTSQDNRELLVNAGVPCPSRRQGKLSGVDDDPDFMMLASRESSRKKIHPKGQDLAVPQKETASIRAGPKLDFGASCMSHTECNSVSDPFNQSAIPNAICWQGDNSGNKCAFCSFCQNEVFDGSCFERCPGLTNFPQCIDASKLVSSFSCTPTYNFSLYRFATPENVPTVQPRSQPSLPELTPHNFIVGPIMISQIRKSQGPCSDVLSLPLRVFSNQTTCARDAKDSTPFGMDPTFLSASSIYDGKISIESLYDDSEVQTVKTVFDSGASFSERIPYGFFPHQYDGNTFMQKTSSMISPEDVDSFKLYFDGILTLSQANNMLAYMQQGGFIDNATSSLDIEMITYNPDLNLFSLLVVYFKWEVCKCLAC